MPEMISEDDARYALDLVQAICTQVGPGMPGSPQERERAAMIKTELETHLGPEKIAVEEFTFAPGAFLGSQLISSLFVLASALLNMSLGLLPGVSPWVTAVAALAFSTGAALLFFLEFVMGFELVDPLFKKQQSLNVTGTLRKPGSGEVKLLLILSGHHDSALEFTWLRFTGYGYFFLLATWLLALIIVLVMDLIQLAGLLAGYAGLVQFETLGWVLLVYPILPSIIFAMTFTRGEKNAGNVPGAADNLSACALAVAMCRFLVQNPSSIPEDTEIRFISFGSEEAGLRGSRRYVKRHLDELKRLDARLLNYETVAYPEIFIMTSDVGGVKHSPEMVNSLVAAAQRAGVPFQVKTYPTGGGGSDAGSFSQAGLKAGTLMPFKMPQQLVAFYHQKKDTPEVLSIEPLFNVLKLTFEWVRFSGESN